MSPTTSSQLKASNSMVAEQIQSRKAELARNIATSAGIPISHAMAELDSFGYFHSNVDRLLAARNGQVTPSLTEERVGILMPENAPILYYFAASRVLNSSHKVDFKPKNTRTDPVIGDVLDIYGGAFGGDRINMVRFQTPDGEPTPQQTTEFFGNHRLVYIFTASFVAKAISSTLDPQSAGKLVPFVEGNSTTYIHRDADVPRAAQMANTSSTWANGQYCKNCGVETVHRDVFESYLSERQRVNDAVVIGEPTDEAADIVHLDAAHIATRRNLLQEAANYGLEVLPTKRGYPYLIVARGGLKGLPDQLLGEFNIPGAILVQVDDEKEALSIIEKRGSATLRGRILELGIAGGESTAAYFRDKGIAAAVHKPYEPTTVPDIFGRHDYDPRTRLGHWLMPIFSDGKVYD